MLSLTQSIGKRIKSFRKQKGLTIDDLGNRIYKSKATISKYESGEIAIDIITLHEIAEVLEMNVEQLLEPNIQYEENNNKYINIFFQSNNLFYAYFYDSFLCKIVSCILEIKAKVSINKNKVHLYVNCESIYEVDTCKNTYYGYIEHNENTSILILNNNVTPLEYNSISIIVTLSNNPTTIGLMSALITSSNILVSCKILFSKNPITLDNELINKVLITPKEIEEIKKYNRLSVD